MFKKKKTPKEIQREQTRSINKEVRALDKEINKLNMEEKKAMAQVKKLTSSGQKGAATIVAKQIVQIRQSRDKMYASRSQLQGVNMQAVSMGTTQAVQKGMTTGVRAMQVTNAMTPAAQVQRTMQNYNMVSEKASMKQEMMDDVFDDEDLDEEADEEVDAILDSLALGTKEKMPSAKVGKIQRPEAEAEDVDDDDLEERLKMLGVK